MFLVKDPATHSALISALKRTFSRSPTVIELLRANRVESEWLKKDGTRAKNNHVFYKCAICGGMFNSNKIQVDHIQPVIPTSIPSRHMDFNMIIDRLFCDRTNLQILCKKDHKEKSIKEKVERREWMEKVKYVVYETRNRINHKRYIGVHKCVDYDEPYLGSGTILKRAIAKYGKDAFSRSILHVYDNADDAYAKEAELVGDAVIESEEYYNVATGGMRGNPDNITKITTPVICHQTGQVFESVTQAAAFLQVECYNISRVLDNPSTPLNNLHFFRVKNYDPKVAVTFPSDGRPITHINSKTTFSSIKKAAAELGLNYRSLRNAMADKNYLELASIGDHYFLYGDEYEPNKEYHVKKRVVKLIELQREFKTCEEAAEFLKKPNTVFAGIAIGRAARTGKKMYKYSWEYQDKNILIS